MNLWHKLPIFFCWARQIRANSHCESPLFSFTTILLLAFCVIACNLALVCEVAAFMFPPSRRDGVDSYHLFSPLLLCAALGVMHVWAIVRRRKTRVNWKFDNSMAQALVGGVVIYGDFRSNLILFLQTKRISAESNWLRKHETQSHFECLVRAHRMQAHETIGRACFWQNVSEEKYFINLTRAHYGRSR